MPKIKNTISDITIKNRKRNINKKKSVQILDAVTEKEYYRMIEHCSNERDRNIISYFGILDLEDRNYAGSIVMML